MAFSYDLTTAIGQLRLTIGDNRDGDGVLPDGRNFDDAELLHWLDTTDSATHAAAAALDALAVAWAVRVDMSVGPRSESLSQTSDAYAARASALRSQSGSAQSSGSFVGGFRRESSTADEYSSGTSF